LMDVWLEEPVPLDELPARLVKAAPPGLTIHELAEVTLKGPSLQSQLEAAEYRVALETRPGLAERVSELLAAVTLPRERRGKAYDLRPLIETIWLEEGEIGMRLAARPGATGRPDEVLLALRLDPLAPRIHRTRLVFINDEKGDAK